jgi:hypothetical protein
MKITAKQIEAGMTIAVPSIVDSKEQYNNYINSPGFLGQSDIDRMKFQVENNLTLSIGLGSVKKSSPVLKVEKVSFSDSWSYLANNRKVTFNSIYLHTDMGVIEIGNRQKVEVR